MANASRFNYTAHHWQTIDRLSKKYRVTTGEVNTLIRRHGIAKAERILIFR